MISRKGRITTNVTMTTTIVAMLPEENKNIKRDYT